MMPAQIDDADADGPPEREYRLDPDGMTALVREQWVPLVRLAGLLLRDRAVAEEIVQDACEAVWRRRPEVAGPGQLVAYLRASVVNGCRSAGRRRGTAARHLAAVRAEQDIAVPAADTDVLRHEDQRQIRAALSRLPQRQREVVVLRYWARLSEAEIARTLDISAGTVKSSAHHALTALRAHLKEQS